MARYKSPVYHEMQRKGYCLLHTLNNLFQEKNTFTRDSLDGIAKGLIHDDPEMRWWTCSTPPFNPHFNKSTGDYDVNVLDAALKTKGKMMVWHDNRTDISSSDLDDDGLMGIVFNTSANNSRHWVALRKIDQFWYNLDSTHYSPSRFKNTDACFDFLNMLKSNKAHILYVRNT